MRRSVRADYEAGVEYLELPWTLKWWQRFRVPAFLGMKPHPFDFIVLSITCGRRYGGVQKGQDLIRYGDLSAAEKDAVAFLHDVWCRIASFCTV